jgi:uncharacterized damage-inducible protein DinB
MSDTYHDLIRMVRAARGLEAGGYYNAAKLLWALVYSQEIADSTAAGIPRGEALDAELGTIIESLRAAGKDERIISALERGRAYVSEDSTVPFEEIPSVYVSRTTGEVFLGEPPEFTQAGDHRLGLQEFPPVWYFNPMTPAQVVAALEAAPRTIAQAISDLTPEEMLIAPAPGEWSMRDLLEHLMQTEELLSGRIEKLLAEDDNPTLVGLAMWSLLQGESASAREILEHYRDSREQLVERLKGIPPSYWWRAGWHSEFGMQTVLSQATYFARHEMSHMPQLYQIRRAVEGK